MSFARRRLGKTVLELEDLTLRAGEKPLLDNVTWRIGPGDRIGLVGVNGSGKTTLLKALGGETKPVSGKRIQGKTVQLAHLTQELEDLPGELRVLQAVEQVAGRVQLGKQELSASQLAEKLGFPAARQWTPVEDLSGGERRRLQLVRLLMAEPNVLLLDEPTNDLDIDTLQQLEDLLDSWPGTMVVVSHDRYLVERVCDAVFGLFGDGKITHLPGGIEEYLARRQGHLLGNQRPQNGVGGSTTEAKVSAAERRAASKELAKLERRLKTLDEKESTLHDALAAAATDPQKLMTLNTELKAIAAEKDDVEARWLETSELAE
jgi:ATP-binding cassette subfamily F protein uup